MWPLARRLLVNSVFQFFTGFELRLFGSRNFNGFARARVAARRCGALGDVKRTEADERDAVFAVQGIGLITENGVLGLGRSAVVFVPRSFGSTAYEALYGNDFM